MSKTERDSPASIYKTVIGLTPRQRVLRNWLMAFSEGWSYYKDIKGFTAYGCQSNQCSDDYGNPCHCGNTHFHFNTNHGNWGNQFLDVSYLGVKQ